MTSNVSKHSLHPIEASPLQARRERVFLILAGLFLGSLTMLNLLGVSRFIVLLSMSETETGWNWTWGQWGQVSFALAVGVLPYPITFLCTDLISEFYGRRRANWVVTVGLLLNLWVVLIIWLAGILPPVPTLDPDSGLPVITQTEPLSQSALEKELGDKSYAFYHIRALTFGAVAASMLAYLAAQFCDVFLFHFWKRLTNGKHLWLRNNGSTLVSQLVDTVAVILITYFCTTAIPSPPEGQSLSNYLFILIATSYVFKLLVALLDTIPIYICVSWLKDYLQFDPIAEVDLSKQ